MTRRVVVVTGASSGIGQAIAVAFSKAGDDLIIHGNQNVAGLAKTREQCEMAGANCLEVLADIAKPTDADLLIERAFAWRKFVDVWINMAGADVLTGDARSWSFEAKLEQLYRVDVAATIRICRLVADRMIEQSDSGQLPSILNVSWDQAEFGMEGESGQYFSATKSAIAAFTKSLAKTYAPKLRVNCIAPGWIQTAWGNSTSDAWHQRAIGESLMQRWGQPEDIANAALFLSSPASSFINAHVLPVNGGRK